MEARAWPIGHALALLFGVLASLPAAPAVAAGVDQGLVVHLGFAGAVRVGVPVPLEIEVPALPEGGPAMVAVDVPALGRQTGEVVTTTIVPFDAVAGAGRAFDVPVVLSDIRRPVVVRVLVAGRERLRRAVPIDPMLVGGRVVVALSDEAAGLEPLVRLSERVVTAYVGAEALPRRWQEYSAVDLLVVRDLDPARLDGAQRDALLTWVRLGGRLLVVARPGLLPPPFLQDVLPASVGQVRVLPPPSPGSVRAGDDLPPGPYAVSPLDPRIGATMTRAGGTVVIAGARAGAGWVELWGFDPRLPAFAEWPGRVRLWTAALGEPAPSQVQIDAVAEQLPAGPSLDPLVHAEVAGAVFVYLAALYLIGRRRALRARALASLAVVAVALVVFWRLAMDVRERSTSVVDVTFVEQASGTDVARALTVGAVAVPYGGRYRVRVSGGNVVAPVTASGDLRAEVTDQRTVLEGTLTAGTGPRTFAALGTVSRTARAELAQHGRTLRVDLGGERAHRVELHWGDRWYWIGDIPSGGSTFDLDPDRWVRSTAADSDSHDRSWIFLGPNGGVIMGATTPVLVGEIEHTVPVFRLEDGGTLGQHSAILLLSVERR
ncbi:MAG TPA: hypothetical protein VKZ50_21560 [bacterium]|nr:hypothetical protein [bacterium]